ncbi:MAG: microcin C ABC transporter permease YejB [Hyphomicrobiaceae bacterium]|nr:microcin C ABC transporter permease YejB [Hyphomicrobiaceae bacterium]
MAAYLIKRFLLIIPTLVGVLTLTFLLAQFAPGGPVERIMAQLTGTDAGATARFGGGSGDAVSSRPTTPGGDGVGSRYRGSQGLDPKFIEELNKQFGFDKPWYERYAKLVWDFARFEFGRSYYRDISVVELIKEKLPVSISLGVWMMLATYLIAIPLGIRKAVEDGSKLDIWSSTALVVGYAIPGFLFAVLLIVVFAGGSFFQWFPRRGLGSDNWAELSAIGKVIDYFWHLVLPLTAIAVGSFTTMTFLTKNSFLDEIKKQYVITARSKGISEGRVLYGHVFRNAMLLIIAGFPSAFVSAFLSGSLLIEQIFSLDGLGLLGFESIVNRDYPVVFATVYIYAMIGTVLHIVSDFIYTLVDPRIDFDTREV